MFTCTGFTGMSTKVTHPGWGWLDACSDLACARVSGPKGTHRIRHVLITAALLATGPELADTAKVMAYSDGPFQDNYTQTVLDPYNRSAGRSAGPHRIEFHGSASSATMLGELRTQKTDPQVDVVIMDTTT